MNKPITVSVLNSKLIVVQGDQSVKMTKEQAKTLRDVIKNRLKTGW
jgi:hypothetical protein